MAAPFTRFTHNGRDIFPTSPRRKGDDALTRAEREALCARGRLRGCWVATASDYKLRLGVLDVGQVRPDPDAVGDGWLWMSYLHLSRSKEARAGSFDKAKAAVVHTVETWFEAVHHPLPHGWRP